MRTRIRHLLSWRRDGAKQVLFLREAATLVLASGARVGLTPPHVSEPSPRGEGLELYFDTSFPLMGEGDASARAGEGSRRRRLLRSRYPSPQPLSHNGPDWRLTSVLHPVIAALVGMQDAQLLRSCGWETGEGARRRLLRSRASQYSPPLARLSHKVTSRVSSITISPLGPLYGDAGRRAIARLLEYDGEAYLAGACFASLPRLLPPLLPQGRRQARVRSFYLSLVPWAAGGFDHATKRGSGSIEGRKPLSKVRGPITTLSGNTNWSIRMLFVSCSKVRLRQTRW